jgi:hypothetical protein
MRKRKLLERALAGSKNIRFAEMVALVEAFGFRLSRVSGSHHILFILMRKNYCGLRLDVT